MFVAIDGGDGVGKSLQVETLKNWFAARGREVAFFRDPGDTALGEALRSILLERRDLDPCPAAETALFMAARAQLIAEKIRPTLLSGKVVLVDRYLLSTAVYQGYAVGADVAAIWNAGRFLTGGVLPDLTFILDCPVETAFARLNRPKDRIEERGIEYRRRVRNGFLQAAADWSKYALGRAVVVDASGTPEETSAAILAELEPLFPVER